MSRQFSRVGVEARVPSNQSFSMETARHRITVFAETASFWQQVEAGIENARSSVWLATYIYRDDACGKGFGERLERAAARGLDVRLLYDSQGSRGARASFFQGLRERGVLVKRYRPWQPRSEVWKYFPRDHGRMLIIDEVAYTGGINWGDEWLPSERGGGDWHDVAVGVQGPCVVDVRQAFRMRWSEADSLQPVADHPSTELATDAEFIADSPSSLPLIYERFCAAIARATHCVWIENSYCVPPPALIAALAAAAARGVDVRLLLPGHTDLPIVQSISRGEYGGWLERGIKLYEYEPRVMHSKFAVIDRSWGTVGTFNAMSPGLWWANETNLVVQDTQFAGALRKIFQADLRQSIEIDSSWLVRIPRWRRIWNALAARLYRGVEWLGSSFGPERH